MKRFKEKLTEGDARLDRLSTSVEKAAGDPKREAFSSKMIEKIKKQMGIA